MKPLPQIPSSKSILNRVLLLCTYLKEPIILQNYVPCNDSATFIDNLQRLGFKFTTINQQLTVFPPVQINKQASLFIKDAGSVYRFLLARLCFEPNCDYEFKISKQLHNRPIQELIDALHEMRAKIVRLDSSTFKIQGVSLKENKVRINTNRSSQFASALYLLVPLAENGLQITLQGSLVSAGYLQLTKRILADFGINIHSEKKQASQICNPETYTLEPDYSAAAYFWLLGCLNDKPITTFYQASQQPDNKFWQILQKMGADVSFTEQYIALKYRRITGIATDMQNMPDQVPSLAIAALFGEGQTVISNIEHLRYKESDRIGNIIAELAKIGAEIEYKNKKLIVNPLTKPPVPTCLDPHQDHRLFMCFSILGKIFSQITIKNSECVQKSFPNFNLELKKIEEYLSFSQLKQRLENNF